MMLKQPINLPIGRNKYRLEEQYQLNFDGYSRIVVPKGFVYDGASVPTGFYWILKRDGLCRAAALIHDFIYKHKGMNCVQTLNRKRNFVYKEVDRKFADDLFYDLLLLAGVKKWKAKTAYRAVRMFGWYSWNA